MTSQISQEDYRRVKEILAVALEIAPAERTSFLQAACPDDEYLRGEVESLLAASERADLFLESFSVARVIHDSIEKSGRVVGQTIDKYRLVGEIWARRNGRCFSRRKRRFSPARRDQINQTRNGFGRDSRTLSARTRNSRRARSSVYRPFD